MLLAVSSRKELASPTVRSTTSCVSYYARGWLGVQSAVGERHLFSSESQVFRCNAVFASIAVTVESSSQIRV